MYYTLNLHHVPELSRYFQALSFAVLPLYDFLLKSYRTEKLRTHFFYVLLTVLLSIILVTNQLTA